MNVPCRIALFVACAFAAIATITSAAAPKQELFPLGIWYEGGVGDARDNVLPADPAKAAPIYDANFKDIAAHGINVMTIPNSPPDHHKLVLDTAQKHNLKVILELGLDGGPIGHMIRGQQPVDEKAIDDVVKNTLTPIKDHPALLRVQLLDEPAPDAFARYGQVAAAFRKFDPTNEPFCCLVGVHDGSAFLKEARSDVVAFDHYPIGVGNKKNDIAPLRDFASVANRFTKSAKEHNARAWAVIQCHEITGGLRFPTPAEMRCMTWTALAQGNKGIFWFLYQSEKVGSSMMNGLVDREFNGRPLWKEVAKLTKQIAPLTARLDDLTDAGELKLKDEKAIARKFTSSDGRAHVIVVNLDTQNDRRIKLDDTFGAFDLPPGGGKLISPAQ